MRRADALQQPEGQPASCTELTAWSKAQRESDRRSPHVRLAPGARRSRQGKNEVALSRSENKPSWSFEAPAPLLPPPPRPSPRAPGARSSGRSSRERSRAAPRRDCQRRRTCGAPDDSGPGDGEAGARCNNGSAYAGATACPRLPASASPERSAPPRRRQRPRPGLRGSAWHMLSRRMILCSSAPSSVSGGARLSLSRRPTVESAGSRRRKAAGQQLVDQPARPPCASR